MIALLLFGIGLPAIVFGALFQNGEVVVLGLIAIGMAVFGCVWRDFIANRDFLHGGRR